MKNLLIAAGTFVALGTASYAEGDVEAGEKAFKRCKACHGIVDADGAVLYKGGKTGPNLYGVVGRVIGSEDFKYGDGLLEAKEAGATWTEEAIAAYVVDPKVWLGDNGYSTKSKMSFKMKKGGADVAAYLATFSAAPAEEEAMEEKSE